MIKERLRKFSDKRSAMIIGGGPSTMDQDWEAIDKLRSQTLMLSCNRIDLIYDRTSWRPDIYTCFASNILKDKGWMKSVERNMEEESTLTFVDAKFKKLINSKNLHDNIVFCKNIKEHDRHKPVQKEFLDVDLDLAFLKSYSATVPLFQICDHLNIREILLVGQDGYIFERKQNHFDERYQHEPKDFEKSNSRILSLHKNLKEYFENKGAKIFNCSKKSILEKTYDYTTPMEFLLR